VEEVEKLVVRAREGCLTAYGELVRRFQNMVYGYAYARLGDFHFAEDATQEVFLIAYRSFVQLREPRAFSSWLRRIVVKCCDRLTRRKRVPIVPLKEADDLTDRTSPPCVSAAEREIRQRVLDSIADLPEHERTAATLFYINGYSQKEISDFLEVPETTVKNRLRSSRKRLKERMIGMVDKTLKSCALPADFADVIVRKVASQEDLKRATEFLACGYHGVRQPENFKSLRSAQEAGIYVVGKEGKVESAGYFDETAIGIGKTVLNAVRPREFAGESRGVPDPVFVKSVLGGFKLAKERGICLAVVHGSQYDHAFCGFVPCFYYPVVTLPCARAKSVRSRARITPATDRQAEAAREAYLRDPFAPKMSAYIGGGKPHIVEQDGAVAGYVRVNRDFVPAKYYGMPFGYVCDITVQTRDAALAVVRLAADLAERGGEREICLMQSHQTLIAQAILSLGGTYLLHGSCDLPGLDAEMVAIIDLPGLSTALKAEFQSRLSETVAGNVRAAFSIESCGQTVGFVAKNGELDIALDRQRVHRLLPRWLVTRLYMGYYSGRDVLSMGQIPWDRSDGRKPDRANLDMKPLGLPKGESELFSALFPKLWPTSLPDPDVWLWIIGKKHPRYQGEKNKTAKVKVQIDALHFPWLGY